MSKIEALVSEGRIILTTKLLRRLEIIFQPAMLTDELRSLFISAVPRGAAEQTVERIGQRAKTEREQAWRLNSDIADYRRLQQRFTSEASHLRDALGDGCATRYANALHTLSELLCNARALEHCLAECERRIPQLESEYARQSAISDQWDLLRNVARVAAGLELVGEMLADELGVTAEDLITPTAVAREQAAVRDKEAREAAHKQNMVESERHLRMQGLLPDPLAA